MMLSLLNQIVEQQVNTLVLWLLKNIMKVEEILIETFVLFQYQLMELTLQLHKFVE